MAQLDLNPIGVARIEALGLVLHADGSVTYNSEHEFDDIESVGLGVWRRLYGGQIGVGLFGFRMGGAGGCAGIFGITPPGNCILKIGTTLTRQKGGGLSGSAVLTFETLDGAALSLPPVPITMTRLTLDDFPGALPAP